MKVIISNYQIGPYSIPVSGRNFRYALKADINFWFPRCREISFKSVSMFSYFPILLLQAKIISTSLANEQHQSKITISWPDEIHTCVVEAQDHGQIALKSHFFKGGKCMIGGSDFLHCCKEIAASSIGAFAEATGTSKIKLIKAFVPEEFHETVLEISRYLEFPTEDIKFDNRYSNDTGAVWILKKPRN